MIFIVEDDSSIRELLEYSLNNSGLDARGFGYPSEFREALKSVKPELIMLDIMLPEEDGLHILRSLRESREYRDIPVIMLTAKSEEYDKVMGLDSGADDYITKPFSIIELIARVRAVLRRTEKQTDEIYTAGRISVNCSSRTVTVDGAEVQLTYKEFELLLMLIRNRNIVMDRDNLLREIWGYDFDGETRTVDVHIRTLRAKLGECGFYIKTVRGLGYKLEAEKQ